MKKQFLLLLLILISVNGISQQNRLQIGETDSTKYPYSLPLFGNFLHDIGIDLPYPVGIMANYFYGIQDILITDIAVGFSDGPGGNDIPLTDITRLIEFAEVKAAATSLNFRPDIWLLPFLNVYGIIGKAWANTEVDISYPIKLKALAQLDGMSFGVGMTFAGGVNKYFGVVDINKTWTYMSNFEEPVGTRVISLRLGRTFPVGKNPESNIGVWAGAMSVDMGGTTTGTITMREILSPDVWDARDQMVDDYWAWYEGVDEFKQEVADRTLTPIVESISDANGDATILYSLTKEAAERWNMIIGGQYQIDKHFQIRAEGGIVGNRKSFLLSANYRFGIKHN